MPTTPQGPQSERDILQPEHFEKDAQHWVRTRGIDIPTLLMLGIKYGMHPLVMEGFRPGVPVVDSCGRGIQRAP